MPQESFSFEQKYITVTHLDYLRYLPKGYGDNPTKKWPLILFLHGAGERGSDLQKVCVHGIPKVAEALDLPFVTLSPQCPQDHWWADYLPTLADLVLNAVTNLSVDPRQVYLTGLSMGGFGTWLLAANYPQLFSAAVPICGGGLWMYGFPERVSEMKHIPTWVFHGAVDPVVPVSASVEMVQALRGFGGDVRLTIYPEAGHDSWSETYNNPELYRWMLEHKKEA